MHLHIRNYTSKNMHLNIMKTWLMWKSWTVFAFMFWVFSALLNLFVFSTCPCLLLLCSSSGCKFKHIDSVARDEQSTTAVAQTRLVGRRRTNPFMLFPSWASENNPCGESRFPPQATPRIIVTLLLHVPLNSWPYQCHWSEMHICPLGIVAAVACYS